MPGVLTVVDDTFIIIHGKIVFKIDVKKYKNMGLEISEFLANVICFQISTATQNYMAHARCDITSARQKFLPYRK